MLAMQLVRAICGRVSRSPTEKPCNIPSVMKNWESFEFFVPLLAMATSPRCAKRSRGWISSSKGSIQSCEYLCKRKWPAAYHRRTTRHQLLFLFYLLFALRS